MVDWSKWKTFGPYKKLWSLVGKRPWTYITRDIWHKLEYIAIVVIFIQAFFIGYFWDEILLWAVAHPVQAMFATLGIFTEGYIAGHFFWGRKYIPGQQGD